VKEGIANERVPIQLAQCRSAGLAISSAKMQKYIFQIKCKEATLSNGTRKLLWSEINKKNKIPIAILKNKVIVLFIIIF